MIEQTVVVEFVDEAPLGDVPDDVVEEPLTFRAEGSELGDDGVDFVWKKDHRAGCFEVVVFFVF